jgi:hypothetical protein
MEVLDSITVDSLGRKSRIELCQGDLTSLPNEEKVDLLVVSAFPDDYVPTPSSLIGALARKGVSVKSLAQNKAVDLRQAFSCWLSQDLVAGPSGIHYKRILCFEPGVRGRPPELVGDIFRALAPFLSGPPKLDKVAMPLVAAGDQGYTVDEMLEPLLEAAVHWMQAGMPLSLLKIVTYREPQAQRAHEAFKQMKNKLGSGSAGASAYAYDVFISYAHEDRRPADRLAADLAKLSLKVFLDRQALQEGSAWQPHIFSAIDSCRKFLALYSPHYVQSKICQEEFNIAWARGRRINSDVIFPVYWKSADLPTYMSMLLYSDCREEVDDGLEAVGNRLVQLFAG